jgi:nicotinamide-nucleotide amidase
MNARKLLKACAGQGVMIAAAESCTGGLVAALLTEIPGSSSVFERGFITYSNEAKTKMLGVPATLIQRHGAVSAQVAKAMAEGALKNSKTHIAVAITGIAGPSGGTKTKPIGLVYIAVAVKKGKTKIAECHFKGGRADIRMSAAKAALELLMGCLARSS